MAYTVRKLLNKAYYLSGIVARNQQTVNGQQITDGLDLLNDLLSLKSTNNRLIPYFSSYSLTAVIDTENYLIPNLIYADSITFNLNTTVRIPIEIQSRKEYFGTVRVNNLTTIPFECNINRAKGGANLYIYPLPNDDYPIAINGKFGLLSNATLNTDLESIYDRFYITYLRYCVAEFICQEMNVSLPVATQIKLESLHQQMLDLSPIDLTPTKLSTLQSNGRSINWGFVNLSGGWTT